MNASDTLKVKKDKRIFIDANFSSDLCSGVLKYPILDNLGLKAIPKFGYTTSINIYYVITKHLSTEAGIQYSKKEYDIKLDFW